MAGLGALVVGAACSAGSSDDVFKPVGSGGTGATGNGGTGAGDAPGDGGTGNTQNPEDAGLDIDLPEIVSPEGVCDPYPDEDRDKDGWTVAQGDCNDCNPSINPGAYDVPGDGIDNDCNGFIDDQVLECDSGLNIADNDAFNGARAMDLCRESAPTDGPANTWGVISAKYVKADGTPGMNANSHGLLPSFGNAGLRKGKALLALSSGTARAPGQPGYQCPQNANMQTSGNPPEGYPKESPACPDVVTGECNDPAALEVEIRVPTNAKSFTFDFNFYTFEFPDYICSTFNDFFVALMWPKHELLPDNNISFDQDGNPVSVNNSLLQVCQSQNAKGKFFPCPLGPSMLQGTGFGAMDIMCTGGQNHAATGWLTTQAPVTAGDILKLRFAIWDSGDHILDSTVLIDNFTWSTETADDILTKPSDPW